MADLALGFLFVLIGSVLVFLVLKSYLKDHPKRKMFLFLLTFPVVIFAFLEKNDHLVLVYYWKIFGFGMFVDTFPMFMAAFVAALVVCLDKSPLRKLFYSSFLMILSFYYVYAGCFKERAQAKHRVMDQVHLQTKPYTCAAACAATLLHHHGISTNEAQMVELCFTSEQGTKSKWLLRGLSRMLLDHSKKVIVKKHAGKIHAGLSYPFIARVGLSSKPKDARFQEQWGWELGVYHMVLVMGLSEEGKVQIADPDVGLEEWDIEGLELLWDDRMISIE